MAGVTHGRQQLGAGNAFGTGAVGESETADQHGGEPRYCEFTKTDHVDAPLLSSIFSLG
jgi:hypothetical protein